MNNRIKEVRNDLGLSQVEFGERIGISGPAVAKIESGINNPSEQTLKLICTAFGVSYLWLKEGIGQMRLPQDTDDEMVDRLMINSNSYARSIMKDFIKVATEDDWEILATLAKGLHEKQQKAGQ